LSFILQKYIKFQIFQRKKQTYNAQRWCELLARIHHVMDIDEQQIIGEYE